jgi:hypothetical protein
MSRAGSDAGPEQTEELISNLNFSGRSGVFLM